MFVEADIWRPFRGGGAGGGGDSDLWIEGGIYKFNVYSQEKVERFTDSKNTCSRELIATATKGPLNRPEDLGSICLGFGLGGKAGGA